MGGIRNCPDASSFKGRIMEDEKKIKIYTLGKKVVEVVGLPEGYEYEVIEQEEEDEEE